jgi:alginate O-acetyltransferase complex protein AlgJ
VGDLVDMLGMRREQQIYTPRSVTIHEVLDSSGNPWESDPGAEILLLGDSYVNIYSQKDMGWGKAAGFAEHLSYELGRPLDVIAQNGSGVLGVRTELARTAETDRFQPKKVLVYEFAERDLLGHNWEVIPLPAPAPAAVSAPPPPAAAPAPASHATAPVKDTHERPPAEPKTEPAPVTDLVLTGHILKTSNVPAPGTAPYVDCLTFVMIQVDKVEAGTYDSPEILAVFWGMKNNVWFPAARYSTGDRLRIRVIPLKRADSSIRTIQRADDTGDVVHQPYFVVDESVIN